MFQISPSRRGDKCNQLVKKRRGGGRECKILYLWKNVISSIMIVKLSTVFFLNIGTFRTENKLILYFGDNKGLFYFF